MFWKSEAQELLEREITHELRKLHGFGGGTKEYQETLERLSMLYEMKEEEKSKSGMSKDNMMVVLGNLVGIILIIKHEDVNVISSKAIQLLLRPFTRT